ncbi:MAG: endonuclease/exonuclease/phosphatase family metal-dependent hydrolase [Planctomycetota bacterium]|jgi:endonuclease/exonuclease/phosphatase family metal-dependent hydrolase
MIRNLAMLCLLAFASCSSIGTTSDKAPALRVLAYNIKHGEGMDGKLDLERVAELIRRFDPDIVTLQEVDRECARTNGVDQAAWLGEACGMHAAFGGFMPYDGGDYGMAVLSREPMLEVTNLRLPDGSEPRTALAVRVNSAQGEVIVCGIHFYRTETERLAQAQVVTEHFRDSDVPVILAGDFNSKPGSQVMEVLEQGWLNIPKGGSALTFPANDPNREIDYCLVQPAESVQSHTLIVVDESLISDHRPLLLELKLASGR